MGGWGGLTGVQDLVAQWRKDIVGDWSEELTGIDLLYLQPVTGRVRLAVTLRADGTAFTEPGAPGEHAKTAHPETPFPETWELSADRVLSIVVPVAPMPKYGMPDWTRDRMTYDVLAVTELSLALSNRRFDGESVFVWRRVNVEDYMRRKAAEYGQVFKAPGTGT